MDVVEAPCTFRKANMDLRRAMHWSYIRRCLSELLRLFESLFFREAPDRGYSLTVHFLHIGRTFEIDGVA